MFINVQNSLKNIQRRSIMIRKDQELPDLWLNQKEKEQGKTFLKSGRDVSEGQQMFRAAQKRKKVLQKWPELIKKSYLE